MMLFLQTIVCLMAALVVVSALPEAKPEAKPHVVVASPLSYSAPLITEPILTSSRYHHGHHYSAPLVAAPSVANSAYSPYVGYPSVYSTHHGFVSANHILV